MARDRTTKTKDALPKQLLPKLPPRATKSGREPQFKSRQNCDNPLPNKVTEEATIALCKRRLNSKKKVVAISGAGISVKAGIPDFRTLRRSSQSLFNISAYCSSEAMEGLHAMIRQIWILSVKASPTLFHQHLNALALKGSLLRHYTQNVDCIESRLPGLWGKTVQLHGRIDEARCQSCGWVVSLAVDMFSGPELPGCCHCQEVALRQEKRGKRCQGIGRLRPNIVLYGEENPNCDFIGQNTVRDLRRGPDAVLVAGTGLKVPGARLMARELCRTVKAQGGLTVWINKEAPPSGLGISFDFVLRGDCDYVASRLWG